VVAGRPRGPGRRRPNRDRGAERQPAGRTLPPEYHPVVAPGYQHLDVLTAAPAQNTGRPEIVSTSLAGFALS
jgi:hypothetical protein